MTAVEAECPKQTPDAIRQGIVKYVNALYHLVVQELGETAVPASEEALCALIQAASQLRLREAAKAKGLGTCKYCLCGEVKFPSLGKTECENTPGFISWTGDA